MLHQVVDVVLDQMCTIHKHPSDRRAKLSSSEIEAFNEYEKALTTYMAAIDLDLLSDMTPPKDLFLRVRVLQDCGQIFTESGNQISLEKNTTHYLRRVDVEQLIRQGLVEQIT